MSVIDEIRKEKQRVNAAETAKQIAHQNHVQNAKKIIPDVVARFKKEAIEDAARGRNTVKRGLFKKRTYVITNRADYFLPKPQYYTLLTTPELDRTLFSALSAAGFENISIERDDINHARSLHITTWLDISE